MAYESFGYSPDVSIRLETETGTIRLADVFENTALLRNPVSLASGTSAFLVIKIGDIEERERVCIHQDVNPGDTLITFGRPEERRLQSTDENRHSHPFCISNVLSNILSRAKQLKAKSVA